MAEVNPDVGSAPRPLTSSIDLDGYAPEFAPVHAPPDTYTALQRLLQERGWAQGSSRRRRLTLDDAIDELFATRSGQPATGAALAHAARVTSHLRELSGGSTLASWNDASARRYDDVVELLEMAAIAFPDD